MKKLSDTLFVAPQIDAADMPAIAAAGIRRIINNRPDGEAPNQPCGNEIAAAARAEGLDYRHIPVAGGLDEAQVAAMGEALADGAPSLAFCRSGTRSAYLWALARAEAGDAPDALIESAAEAGCDLTPIRALLDRAES